MNQIVDILFHLEKHIEQLAILHPVLTYCLLFAIIFVETSLFPLAPFLPGDGLLFVVGVLAASGRLNLLLSLFVLNSAGIIGNFAAYLFGHRLGAAIFIRKRWLNSANLQKTELFYARHGSKAMFISRFIPVMRAIVPLVAGFAPMNFKKFSILNLSSVFIWVITITLLSLVLGQYHFIKAHYTWIIYGMVFISAIPIVYLKIKHINNKNRSN